MFKLEGTSSGFSIFIYIKFIIHYLSPSAFRTKYKYYIPSIYDLILFAPKIFSNIFVWDISSPPNAKIEGVEDLFETSFISTIKIHVGSKVFLISLYLVETVRSFFVVATHSVAILGSLMA